MTDNFKVDSECCVIQDNEKYYLTEKHTMYIPEGNKVYENTNLDFTIEELALALEYNCIVEPAYQNSNNGAGKFSARIYSEEKKYITEYLENVIIPHILLGKLCK